jgi:hypothetical protein
MAMSETDEKAAARDATNWAKKVSTLNVSEVPEGAININVEGKRLASPIQGFGKMWQKTYQVRLPAESVAPDALIATWKQRFPEFWPEGNAFYGPLTGIEPGEVALVVYLGAGCSALTYALWGYALRHIEAGRAASFDTLIPVVGIVTAVLVLQEAPLVWHIVGGALVVTGIWLAVCEPRPIALPGGLRCATGPRLEYPEGAWVSGSEALSDS